MRILPGFAGRLDRRQFIAVVIAAAAIGVILLAVGLHAAGLPSPFPDSSSDRLTTGDGVTVDEPAPVIPIAAAPGEVDAPTGGSPVGALLNGAASVPPPQTTPAPSGPQPPPTTSTTAPPPPPPPPTTTTLPPLVPGLPIGGPGGPLS